MKTIKFFIILLLVIALNSVHTTAEEKVHSQKPRSHHNGRAHKSHKVVATANHMGYMDTATNKLSRKFLDFAPHAPGHIMDLGCAWGYAIEQLLAIERRKPFLGKERKFFALDMAQEHLDHIAKKMPHEGIETHKMRFPYQASQKDKDVFSPDSLGAIYAGLIFPYLSGDELTQGLKLLYRATAPGGRIYVSVHTPFDNPPMTEDFLRRKKDSSIAFPGWYPDGFGQKQYMPEIVRDQMPDFIHVFDEELLSSYLRNAGFHVLECMRFLRGRMYQMQIIGIVAEKKAK